MKFNKKQIQTLLRKSKTPAVIAAGVVGTSLLPNYIGYKEENKDSTLKGGLTSAALGGSSSYVSTTPEYVLPKKWNKRLLKTVGKKHYKAIAKNLPLAGGAYGLFSGAASYEAGKGAKRVRERLFGKTSEIINRKDLPQYKKEELINLQTEYINPLSVQPLQRDKDISRKKVDKIKEEILKLEIPDELKHSIKPIVINGDGYIVDGHHRWAAFKDIYGDSQNIPVKVLPDGMSKKAEKVFNKLLKA